MVHGETVACPLHNWQIDLADGCARSPDVGCIPRFAVQVQDGQIHLDADELMS
jgi:nitrite reductase (NADH) small subunit